MTEAAPPPSWYSSEDVGDSVPATEVGREEPWFLSWPAVAVGLIACIVPGLALLWLRTTTSRRHKTVVTAGIGLLSGVVLLGGATLSRSSPSLPRNSPTASAGQPTDGAATAPEQGPATNGPSPPSAVGSAGSAIAAVTALPVKGRAPESGYDRDLFGNGWVDIDRNGCDSRNDALGRDLRDKTMAGNCRVLSGTLDDPYTGLAVRFVLGGASEVDVDHVVSLSDAWQKGAQSWPTAKLVAFANDPLNLQPTDSSVNRQKGEGDAATWLPPYKAGRCAYVARQAAVKTKYELSVTAAEQAAMLRVLGMCPDTPLPPPGPQPTIASNTGGIALQPELATTASAPAGVDPDYGTCANAKSAGEGPYVQGVDKEYAYYEDPDGDGVACE